MVAKSEIKKMYIKPWPWSVKSLYADTDPYDQLLFDLVKGILERTKFMSFCEVGFGGGRYLRYCAEKFPLIVGVEISAELTKMVKTHSNLGNIMYVVADAEHLPFRKESFELVLSTETIEHLPYPKKALYEINWALAAHGKAILSVPCFIDMSPMWATVQKLGFNSIKIGKYVGGLFGITAQQIEHAVISHHHKTQFEWKAIAKAAGFRVILRSVMVLPIYIWGTSRDKFYKKIWFKKLIRLLDETVGSRFPFYLFGHGLLLICQKK